MSEEPFRLTDGERMHPLWRRLKAHLDDRLAELRRRNDDPSMDAIQTAVLRGRLMELRAYIAYDAERPVIGD